MAISKITSDAIDATGFNLDSNTLTIDATNNAVGVGTASPNTYGKFVAFSSGGHFSVDTNGQVNSTQSVDVATAGGRFTGSSSRGALGSIHIEQTTTGADGGYIGFRTSPSGSTTPSERMRIDSSGRVLQGTSSAPLKWWNGTTYGNLNLIENNNITNANFYVTQGLVRNTADSEAAQLGFAKSRGTTSGSATVVQDGDALGILTFQGADGTNYVEGARISATCDGTPSGNDMPTRLQFYTTADGNQTVTERMRLTSNGQANMGDNPSLDADQNLSAQGQILALTLGGTFGEIPVTTNCGSYTTTYTHLRFYNGNGLVGNISTNGSSTTYSTSSDYRLKENVTNITDGITRLKQLNPSRFNFIADDSTTVDGFLAHEAATVVPEAVTGEKDAVDADGNPDYQGIDQSKLVPLLTAALQEAIAKIETLETQRADLETRLSTLETV